MLLAPLVLFVAPNVVPPNAALEPRGDEVWERFAAFDQDGDGVPEIERIEALHTAGTGDGRVLLLVEARLLEPLEGAPDVRPAPDLRPALERWADDLAREGRRAEVLAVTLAPSETHQDGRYVLALREVLRAADAEGDLAGAVLLGHFPDALIVRTCNWRKRGDVTLHRGTEGVTHRGVHYLRRVPEAVAHRGDIVLADLDGRWEDVYVQPRTRLETVHAVFDGPPPPHGGPCVDLERGGATFADFFHVSDGVLEVSERVAADGTALGPQVTLFDATGDHECADADRGAANVLAHPDVRVSRLDARGVALRPRSDVVGSDGAGLTDANGRPRAVPFASPDDVPKWNRVWEPDPVLERELLVEALDRNHAYRSGDGPVAWRASSIAHDLGSGLRTVDRAADWEDGDPELRDVHGTPTVERFVDWFTYPALLRTVRAHSDPWGSAFQKPGKGRLDARLGGPAWSFARRGSTLVPSLDVAASGGKQDWFLLRSLHANGLVPEAPSIYLHAGCEAISPPGWRTLPFDDPKYGERQGAESLLLLGGGLALVGRSKVFYDEPRGFAEALRAGGTVGDAWARYFEIEGEAASWGQVGGDIGRKRAYFWSVLGDWTLTLDMGRRAVQPKALPNGATPGGER